MVIKPSRDFSDWLMVNDPRSLSEKRYFILVPVDIEDSYHCTRVWQARSLFMHSRSNSPTSTPRLIPSSNTMLHMSIRSVYWPSRANQQRMMDMIMKIMTISCEWMISLVTTKTISKYRIFTTMTIKLISWIGIVWLIFWVKGPLDKSSNVRGSAMASCIQSKWSRTNQLIVHKAEWKWKYWSRSVCD